MTQDETQHTADALHDIDPAILLKAIRAGAKPHVDAHLSRKLERQRDELAASFKVKVEADGRKLKETEELLTAIRGNTTCKIEDHLSEEREVERDELAKGFQLKHKQESKQVKAARRRLEAIRSGAHCKVDDHTTKQTEAYEHLHQQKKLNQLREEKRELKAHQRKLKGIASHAAPKVSARLSDTTESGREQRAHARAERTHEQRHQVERSRQMLKAMRAGSPTALAQSEKEYHAAVLLQAARRGSLARAIATPPSKQGVNGFDASTAPSPRIRKALHDAANNRLSQRRPAVVSEGQAPLFGVLTAEA